MNNKNKPLDLHAVFLFEINNFKRTEKGLDIAIQVSFQRDILQIAPSVIQSHSFGVEDLYFNIPLLYMV
jgi:hypothetical protein